MLAAFESALRQNAKDDADWKKTERLFYAPPKHVLAEQREARRTAAVAPARGSMSLSSAESLIARLNAADTRYGAR